jgi:hypothetical protein
LKEDVTKLFSNARYELLPKNEQYFSTRRTAVVFLYFIAVFVHCKTIFSIALGLKLKRSEFFKSSDYEFLKTARVIEKWL